ADSLATGPATWSSWKASLVGTLVSRIDAALSDEVDGAGIAGRAEAVRAEALTALADSDTVECAFARRAPLRYLAAHSSAEVVRDARLVAELTRSGGGADGRVAVSPGPAEGTHALTIVSHDRPELLARIAGALALAGLDILSVDAYGAPGHIALDRFVVRSATLRPATTETFASFERLLGAALRDRLELKTRLSERRRHYPAKSTAPVKVRVGSAGYDTAVRVSAPDRPGLLHDLAQAVSATGLDIRRAKVLTVDGMAIDTFHVVDSVGSPVTDDGVIGHLVMRMREIR
ncbi:MAG: ACT domain-containing protein, partial [Coriobacteriia bacterium]|nr:ACT domain-containing protein [Coriobacteriia bacterium]